MARQSTTDKQIDKLVERAYYATCSGIQIDIMDIGKVFEHGRRLILMDKVDKAGLERGIREYVETIRCDKEEPSWDKYYSNHPDLEHDDFPSDFEA